MVSTSQFVVRRWNATCDSTDKFFTTFNLPLLGGQTVDGSSSSSFILQELPCRDVPEDFECVFVFPHMVAQRFMPSIRPFNIEEARTQCTGDVSNMKKICTRRFQTMFPTSRQRHKASTSMLQSLRLAERVNTTVYDVAETQIKDSVEVAERLRVNFSTRSSALCYMVPATGDTVATTAACAARTRNTVVEATCVP